MADDGVLPGAEGRVRRRVCPRRPLGLTRKVVRTLLTGCAALALLLCGAVLRDLSSAGRGIAHDGAGWQRRPAGLRAALAALSASVALSPAPLRDFELLFLDPHEVDPPHPQKGLLGVYKPPVAGLRRLAHARLHALIAADAPDPLPPRGSETYYRALTRLHTARYVAAHGGRLPPKGYDEFVRWAADRNCEVDDYGLIDEDLEPYRRFYAGRPEALKKAAAGIIDRYPHIYGIKIRGGKTIMDYTSEFEIEARAAREAAKRGEKPMKKGKKGKRRRDGEEKDEKAAPRLRKRAPVDPEPPPDDGIPPAPPDSEPRDPILADPVPPDTPDGEEEAPDAAEPVFASPPDADYSPFNNNDRPPRSPSAPNATADAFDTPPQGRMAQPSNATDDEPPILDWMKEVYPPLIDPFAYALPDMDVPFNFYDEPRMFARLDDFLEGPPMSDDEAALLDTLANRTSDDVFRDLVSGLEPAWQDWTAEAKAMGCVDGVDDHGFFLGPTTLAFVDLTPRRVPMLNASTPEYWAAAEKLRGHKPFPFPHYPRDTPHRVLLPIFGGAKPRQCFADITLPSYAALTYGSYPWGWDAQPAWERKAERVYWRGTTTGGWIAGGRDWRRFHRQRLIKNWAGRRVSIPVPEGKAMWDGEGAPGSVYFDIFLTGVKQCDESPGSAREDPAAKDVLGDPEGWDEGFEPSVCDLAHRYYEGLLVKEYKRGTENLTVPEQEYWSKHWGVKYLIDLDGNAWSQRFQQFLWSNSLVLHAGVFREWFSGWFRAYEHWIPVRMDLSDLERTIRWASGTDEGRFEAKRVGERARELARRRLRYEDMQSYMFLLLLEYGSIGKEEYLWDL